MGSRYVKELVQVLVNAGVQCAIGDTNAGWETRSRSSGGFDADPIGIQWHHTASKTTPPNDLSYMIYGSPDKPVGNMLLDRDGVVWPVAAGAANTSGKGGPNSFSRGVCPLDKGNTYLWSIEIANNGVGEPYPQVQIDAAFRASNALNRHFGNTPIDVVTHSLGAGDGYTSRKIDPATASAVQGPWKPSSVTSSGTWSLADLRAECALRDLPPLPGPTPIPDDEDDVIIYAFREYANTWSQQGIHLSAEAYNALVAQGAQVVVSELTWPHNQHLNSLMAVSGTTEAELVPK